MCSLIHPSKGVVYKLVSPTSDHPLKLNVNKIVRVEAGRKSYLPSWVRSNILEQLWSSEDFLHINAWEGSPRKNWFRRKSIESDVSFVTADMEIVEKDIGQFAVEFVNGRHRTRWLLGLGYENIPVGLTEQGFAIAKKAGLVVRRVNKSEKLSF